MHAIALHRTRPRTTFLSPALPAADPAQAGVTCTTCKLRSSCLSSGLRGEDLARAEGIVHARTRIRRGDALFMASATPRSIFAVRSGFFKSTVTDRQGREQVTGFSMRGDLLGLEGLTGGLRESRAVALEDSEVCSMPYVLVEQLGQEIPAVQRRLNSALAWEIQRNQGIMLLLGRMCAEERVAAFLISLSGQFAMRGYSGSDFVLRMTRGEIGSFLGLKLETVSRMFSAFHRSGLIEVRQRQICILDITGLERVLDVG
jgi:CRP/FNR family transcriptional regulator